MVRGVMDGVVKERTVEAGLHLKGPELDYEAEFVVGVGIEVVKLDGLRKGIVPCAQVS